MTDKQNRLRQERVNRLRGGIMYIWMGNIPVPVDALIGDVTPDMQYVQRRYGPVPVYKR